MNKQETVLVVILICVLTFIVFMSGRIYEQINQFTAISREAEKHKQRFYDEGYADAKAELLVEIVLDPNDEGIFVGTGPTRDYSNYSDPCQGASYNTDPNIMWSLVVSDPNLIRSVEVSFPKFVEATSITFHGSDGVQRSIGAKELKEMTVEEIKNMATCIIIMSYSGGMDAEWNDILIEKLLVNP